MKGRAVASLILILLPYATFAALVVSIPSPDEASFATSQTHFDCSQYASSARTLQVSQGAGQYATISAAVSAANPGDRIMVHQGTYHEAVLVTKPCMTISGTDRKGVVLDGGNSLENGIEASQAPGITVANLTARNYTYNGVYFERSNDWAMRGIISVDDGHYGLYAVASTYGVMADDYTMGNGDSGFYIGAVPDCSCTIVNSTAYGNVVGYSGTVANGVTIRDSKFVNNSVGIGPNTLLPDWPTFLSGGWKLPLAASNHTIEDNLVAYNNNATVTGEGISQTYGVPIGTGIMMAGTSNSVIRNNTVTGNHLWGIAEFTFFNVPMGNTYSGNRFVGNGQDYFNDGTGLFGCSTGETATGNVPPSCSAPSWLRITIPNPINELVLMLKVGTPGISGNAASVVFATPLLVVATAGVAGKASGLPSRGRRLATSLVDLLVAGDIYLLVISFLVVFGFGASDPTDVANLAVSFSLLLFPLAYLVLVTVRFFYGVVLEGLRGETAGMWLLGIRTARAGDGKVSFSRILLKNVFIYVDTLFFGLVGALAILAKGRTVGELVSGTATKKRIEA